MNIKTLLEMGKSRKQNTVLHIDACTSLIPRWLQLLNSCQPALTASERTWVSRPLLKNIQDLPLFAH